MVWPFGKKDRPREKARVIESEIPADHERYGPTPPPPRTAHTPGAAVHAFAEIPPPHLLRFGEGGAGFLSEREEGTGASTALLMLLAAGPHSSASPGDVLIWNDSPRGVPPPPGSPSPSYSLEEICRPPHQPTHHIRRDALAGRGVAGVTGLRTLHAGAGLTVLRLGPPPGARWVFVGLRALAVFAGKLTLTDGEEVRVVPAGHLALVSDPTATLYVEAGNDSALAVGLGSGAVISALG